MLNVLNKLCDIVFKIVYYAIIVFFTATIVCCVVQVFCRYVLNNSPAWSEEIARFTFIWGNLLGATICTRKHSHAAVSVLVDLLPSPVKKYVNILITVSMWMLAYVMLVYGVEMAQKTFRQLSSATEISMSFMYGSVPVAGAILLLYLTTDLLGQLTELFKKRGGELA